MQQKGKCFKTQNPKIRAQKSRNFISCYKIMKNESNSRFVSINKSNTKSTAIPQQPEHKTQNLERKTMPKLLNVSLYKKPKISVLK